MPENPLNYSKADHYRKFQEWKQGEGSHWFEDDKMGKPLSDKSLSELKVICRECHLKDECGECRMPLYKEKALERELYSIHSLCVNCEC